MTELHRKFFYSMNVIDMLSPYAPAQTLKSASQGQLIITHSQLSLKGVQAFSVYAPRLWNSPPLKHRSTSSVTVFNVTFKIYLFTPALMCHRVYGYSWMETLLVMFYILYFRSVLPGSVRFITSFNLFSFYCEALWS